MNLLPHKIFKYHLYIFQLEEYDIKRFWDSLFKKGLIPSKSLRKNVIWTSKAKILAFISIIFQIFFSIVIAYFLTNVINRSINMSELAIFCFLLLFTFYLLSLISFIFLSQSADIIYPIELIIKHRVIKQAKAKIIKMKKDNPSFKIIGITGSYGKTTMKEIVSTVLTTKFNIVKTQGNNNTPLGISRTILNRLNNNTDLFVVEMGEYVKGDVKALCEITPPDISIITGINEAHLERYGSMKNAISTKFEIIENSNNNALIILNADDDLTINNYARYTAGKKVLFFSSKNNKLSDIKVENIEIDQNGNGLSFIVKKPGEEFQNIQLALLAEYAIGNIIAAILVGSELEMTLNEIKLGISKISPVEHRLEPRLNPNNILVIDDTYNGNSNGIKEGIILLKRFKNRRKVYVTPGLVETGSKTEEIHLEIGKMLTNSADLVILIRNSVTNYIYQGLIESGFKLENIIWYENSKDAYANLYKHLQPNDVVLMQNDWSDNYS